MNKPDIVVYLSDQHGGKYLGCNGHSVIKTPNIDRIASQGVNFANAYTSCPLCVPARSSMLSCKLPSKTGVFLNNDSLNYDVPTFLHALTLQGYETVLCGRMHFIGVDQRHGFNKRIFGDFTSIDIGSNPTMLRQLQKQKGTLGESGCMTCIGKGDSCILEYDRQVVKTAIEYLQVDHDKPQCLVIGTYAPHFTYVAEDKWFDYYYDKVDMPVYSGKDGEYVSISAKHKEQTYSEDKVRAARAAYYGMISGMDEQIGAVEDVFAKHLKDSGKSGLFVYTSDHGDANGERLLYGKRNFFEGAGRIPLVVKGSGVNVGKTVVQAVSLMDLGSTLCEIAQTQMPYSDGVSLCKQLFDGEEQPNRIVLSEVIDDKGDEVYVGRMAKQGNKKLIIYEGDISEKMYYNTLEDPYELHNLYAERSREVEDLEKAIYTDWDVAALKRNYSQSLVEHKIIAAYNKAVGPISSAERWDIPPQSVNFKEI